VLLGSKALQVREDDNLTADCLNNVGSSTSHNSIGLHGLLRRWPFLCKVTYCIVEAVVLIVQQKIHIYVHLLGGRKRK
jgi:hypothetical protein